MKVKGENPFSVMAHSFCVSPSAEGYTLNFSGDGIQWTAYATATEAGDNLVVNGIAKGMYFKLVGNQSEVTITY